MMHGQKNIKLFHSLTEGCTPVMFLRSYVAVVDVSDRQLRKTSEPTSASTQPILVFPHLTVTIH